MLIPVILHGGAGARLWPVSRQVCSTPRLRPDEGESLLAGTLTRALRVARDGDVPGEVITVTGADCHVLCRDEYSRHPAVGKRRLTFLLEPAARGTGPALLLAALHVRDRYAPHARLLALPTDHLIRDLDAFATDVARANCLAADGRLVAFGVTPAAPETGFGYIRAGLPTGGGIGSDIASLIEKPDTATAQSCLDSGEYLWNSGIFCFRADALLRAAAATCPGALRLAERCHALTPAGGSPVEFARKAFLDQPDISIDYAVMERAPHRSVIPASFDWNDVGSWRVLSARGGSDARDRVREMRAAAEQPSTAPLTVLCPWGSYTVLEDAPDIKVKRLIVRPGETLSLQVHHQRSEHWTVVRGVARVRVGDSEFLLRENESAHIPVNTVHRLENTTAEDVHLIEVQCGRYFGEDDIVRLEDRYGRAPAAPPGRAVSEDSAHVRP